MFKDAPLIKGNITIESSSEHENTGVMYAVYKINNKYRLILNEWIISNDTCWVHPDQIHEISDYTEDLQENIEKFVNEIYKNVGY